MSAGSLNVQNGIYSISGAALASATNAYVGNSGGEGEGSVNQTGGTQTISNLYIYNGTYSLGGSGSLSSSNAYLDSNYGNFNQTGGTYNVSNFLSVAVAGGNGSYSLSGSAAAFGRHDRRGLRSEQHDRAIGDIQGLRGTYFFRGRNV